MSDDKNLNEFKNACLTSVRPLFPLAQMALEDRITRLLEECGTKTEALAATRQFVMYIEDLQKSNSYPMLNIDSNRKYSVRNTGDYRSFSEAVKDFYRQLDLPRDIFIKYIGIAGVTLRYFIKDSPPKPLDEMSNRQRNSYERTRKRILERLDIIPPEAVSMLQHLPIFS